MKKVWLYLKCAESCVDYESARNFVEKTGKRIHDVKWHH
jgi:hypothetical protein